MNGFPGIATQPAQPFRSLANHPRNLAPSTRPWSPFIPLILATFRFSRAIRPGTMSKASNFRGPSALRISRRTFLSTILFVAGAYWIAQHRAQHVEMQIAAAFWARPSPRIPPSLPERTAEGSDAECRAAALASDALAATFESFDAGQDSDVAAQFNALGRALSGPGNCGNQFGKGGNESSREEWKRIFRNLPVNLISTGEATGRSLPYLAIPRTASDETRLDLALVVSLVAQQLTASQRSSTSTGTFEHFSTRQVCIPRLARSRFDSLTGACRPRRATNIGTTATGKRIWPRAWWKTLLSSTTPETSPSKTVPWRWSTLPTQSAFRRGSP